MVGRAFNARLLNDLKFLQDFVCLLKNKNEPISVWELAKETGVSTSAVMAAIQTVVQIQAVRIELAPVLGSQNEECVVSVVSIGTK